jgi:hypothetical protein
MAADAHPHLGIGYRSSGAGAMRSCVTGACASWTQEAPCLLRHKKSFKRLDHKKLITKAPTTMPATDKDTMIEESASYEEQRKCFDDVYTLCADMLTHESAALSKIINELTAAIEAKKRSNLCS